MLFDSFCQRQYTPKANVYVAGEPQHIGSDGSYGRSVFRLQTDDHREVLSKSCLLQSKTPSVGDVLQPGECVSPFTPCLTPCPSIGSSAASSPGSYNMVLSHDEVSQKAIKRTRRMSIDSGTSRGSSPWSTSPLLDSISVLPYFAPDKVVDTSTASTQFEASHKDGGSISNLPIVKRPVEPPPKKKARHSTKFEPSNQSATSANASLPILSIPPAQASDIPASSKKKRNVQSDPPKKASKRPARRRKGEGRATSPQPIKFRFVTVHHSTDAAENVSTSVEDEEKHVHFEEHMEEEVEEGPFEHGPTEYPPRPYPGGEYAVSPLRLKREIGKIPASNLDFLPVLEDRFRRLENAIEKYVEYRAQQALKNSILPT